MYGAYIRSVLYIGGAVLLSAIISIVATPLLAFQGPTDSLLYESFAFVIDEALLLMLLSIALGLVARASVEGGLS